MGRTAEIKRTTKETDITARFSVDGSGKGEIDTGVGFFNHMLEGFTRHGFFDLALSCTGDLEVDCHHTIEDCGLVLGRAIKEASGDKAGIVRFGSMILPMDDALILCAVDFSGRAYLNFDVSFTQEGCGDMETAMAKEFFRAVSNEAGMNIHIVKLAGENDHHIMEAAFKAFAKALAAALQKDPRIEGVLSTKESLS
ncbi:MAG: imidazoleglycerol-phosphate dehydratase HisB [Lachnospiraceae bacterium]|nr:imidazoleglycerol-phosphate dehydratase HisB [Lachnospiraceae bacterium]